MIKAVRGVDKPPRQSRSLSDQFRQIACESHKTYNPLMLTDTAHSTSTKTADARPVPEQHRVGRVQLLFTPKFSVERCTVTTKASETVARELAEAPIDAARGELEAEAGYRTGGITPMVEFFTAAGISTERMHAFVATDLRPVSRRLEPGKFIETEVLTLNEVRTKLTASGVHDGKTMDVLGLYFMRINEKQAA